MEHIYVRFENLRHVFGDACAYPSLYLYVIELSLVYFI